MAAASVVAADVHACRALGRDRAGVGAGDVRGLHRQPASGSLFADFEDVCETRVLIAMHADRCTGCAGFRTAQEAPPERRKN